MLLPNMPTPKDIFAKLQGVAQASGYPDFGSVNPPQWQYSGPSAADMAAADFANQYAMLDKMRGQTTTRYDAAGRDMGGAYDALSKAMRGEVAGIRNNAAQTANTIGGTYNNALNQTRAGYDKSQSDVAALARSLGVEAALPAAQQESRNQENLLSGLIADSGASSMSLARQLGENAANYQGWSADTARLAGNNARSDFKSKLMDALAGLDTKRLEIAGNETQARNQYQMEIQKMQQQAAAQAADAAYKQQRDSVADELAKAKLALDQSRFGLETDKYNNSLNNPAAGASKDPYVRLADAAKQLYPGAGQVTLTNAIAAVSDTFSRGYQGDRQWTDAGDFVGDVLRRNPNARDRDQLAAMAYQFYTDVVSGGGGKGINTSLIPGG